MLDQQYNSEIEILLAQFLSAFDDCVIRRGKDENGKEKYIVPRYLIGNKTRVFTDIVNAAGNITLPVVVGEVQSIAFDSTRSFNKQLQPRAYMSPKEIRYKQPTPIKINLSVNFYTKFFGDIWQMFTNFAAFTNPYFFISWQTPQELQTGSQEIRCQALWGGNFVIDYPRTAEENQNWLIHGTSEFTIEGWIFNRPSQKFGVITSVENEMAYNTNVAKIGEKGIEYFNKDGWPSITNVIVDNIRLRKGIENYISIESEKTLIIEGRSFFANQCTGLLVKPVDPIDLEPEGLTPVTIDTIKMGEVSGFAITEEMISMSENLIKFKLPKSLVTGTIFDIYVFNNAGFTSISKEKGFFIKIV